MPEPRDDEPDVGRADSSPRVWVTADVLAGESEPEAIIRTAELEWAVTGVTVPPEPDWTIVDEALVRWPVLQDVLDSPIGVEVSLRSGRPTGRRVRPFAPDEWIRVSARVADGSATPGWVARNSAGEWFVAEAKLAMNDPSAWLSAHGRHLIERFDDLSRCEVVGLGPNESAEMTDDGAWIVTKQPD